MKAYFGQFGEVTRLRLSRNKKTGKSKHYAYVEFKHPEAGEVRIL
jgi:nucleolar protein 15